MEALFSLCFKFGRGNERLRKMLPNLHDDPKRWFECANKMRSLSIRDDGLGRQGDGVEGRE